MDKFVHKISTINRFFDNLRLYLSRCVTTLALEVSHKVSSATASGGGDPLLFGAETNGNSPCIWCYLRRTDGWCHHGMIMSLETADDPSYFRCQILDHLPAGKSGNWTLSKAGPGERRPTLTRLINWRDMR